MKTNYLKLWEGKKFTEIVLNLQEANKERTISEIEWCRGYASGSLNSIDILIGALKEDPGEFKNDKK